MHLDGKPNRHRGVVAVFSGVAGVIESAVFRFRTGVQVGNTNRNDWCDCGANGRVNVHRVTSPEYDQRSPPVDVYIPLHTFEMFVAFAPVSIAASFIDA